MAYLRLPITGSGPELPVLIGLPGIVTTSLKASGQPIPAPLLVRGVIDTGTDITGVVANQLSQLGILPAFRSSTHTAGGSVRVDIYEISLSVPGPDPSAGLLVVRPDLLVMELAAGLPDVDLLLGRDVLDECLFVYDGRGKHFLLGS
jgi:hypothetical protein